jgi:hypothetical protein
MRLAWGAVSEKCAGRADDSRTHVFDIRARMDGDDVAVLDAEVVANNAVQPGAAIIEIIVGQNNEDRVLSLLASDKDCVAAEQLERLHGVVGEGDDRVIIVDGIGDPGFSQLAGEPRGPSAREQNVHKLVGLLLLLQNGGRCAIVLLFQLAGRNSRIAEGRSTNILALGTRRIAEQTR